MMMGAEHGVVVVEEEFSKKKRCLAGRIALR
jgi:hypothetical protein